MKLRILSLACALALLLSGCAFQRAREESEGGYAVYFATAASGGGPAVESERRELPAEADPAEALLAALFSGPLSETLRSPFPQGVHVLSVERDKRALTVDLSERYGGLSGAELTVADYCIALTLCQLPGVDAVSVTVEGEPIPFRNRQLLRTGDALLSGAGGEAGTLTALVYYPRRDGLLYPERRDVPLSGSGSSAFAVLSALLAGPEDPDLYLSLPEGAVLLSAAVESGTCYVDFSREFLTNAPKDHAEAALLLYSVVDTLCSLDGVESVRLLIGGAPVSRYGGTATDLPLTFNAALTGLST